MTFVCVQLTAKRCLLTVPSPLAAQDAVSTPFGLNRCCDPPVDGAAVCGWRAFPGQAGAQFPSTQRKVALTVVVGVDAVLDNLEAAKMAATFSGSSKVRM